MKALVVVLIVVGSLAGAACGGGGKAPGDSSARVLIGIDVDDLSTATPGSCRRYARQLRRRMEAGTLSKDTAVDYELTLRTYEARALADENAACVDPLH
jgi:hypothetical protein